jgi:hypothetical protein
VAHVTDLRLGAELLRERTQALRAAGHEDEPPAVRREPPGQRLPDPARASGYDRDANARSVLRLISTVSSIGSA